MSFTIMSCLVPIGQCSAIGDFNQKGWRVKPSSLRCCTCPAALQDGPAWLQIAELLNTPGPVLDKLQQLHNEGVQLRRRVAELEQQVQQAHA